MITRKVTKINQIHLNPTIQLIEIDPHCQFVAIYIFQHSTIFLIKTSQFSTSLYESFFHYQKENQYTNKLLIDSCSQIKPQWLGNQKVQLIKIGKKWQDKQYIAVAILDNIRMFEVRSQCINNQELEITVHPHKNVILGHQSLILSMRLHYSTLYVSFFDREMKVYELENQKVWIESEDINTLELQFLRLAMFKDRKRRNKIKRKKNFNDNYEQNLYDIEQLTKNDLKELLEILSIRNIQTYFQNYPKQNNQQTDILPEALNIIYQSSENALYLATYNSTQNMYTTRQLCPSKKFKPLKLYEESYYEYENENEQESHGSEQQTGSSNERMTKNDDRMENGENMSKRKEQHQNQQQFQEVEQLIADPLMYQLTNCQNYIINQFQQTYTILSKHSDWKAIHTGNRYPCINTFYQQLQKSILLNIFINNQKKASDQITRYLKDNFQIALIAFPTDKKYGDNSEIEIVVLSLELIVVDKMEEVLREGKQKKDRQSQMFQLLVDRYKKPERSEKNDKLTDLMRTSDWVKQKDSCQKISQRQNSQSSNQQQTNIEPIRGQQNLKKTLVNQQKDHKNNQNLQLQQQQQPQQIPQHSSTLHPNTYTFPIAEFKYLKGYPLHMQWITQNEIIFTTEQRTLCYFQVMQNLLFSKLKRIYFYLIWLKFRDCGKFKKYQEIQKIIDQLYTETEENSRIMQVEEDDNEDVQI